MEERDQKAEIGSQTPKVRRLFCWSGGGFPGLDIHCGIWLALEEAGIYSDGNAGSSAGALIAALYSSGKSAVSACALLRSLRDEDMRKERFAWKLRIPWLNSFLDPAPIQKVISANVPDYFSDLQKPLSVFVTRESPFAEYEISQDYQNFLLDQALLASMSIAGVFPPVRSCFSDGGPTANLPLPRVFRAYDEVYLLVAKRPLSYCKNKNILTRLMWNVDAMAEDQVLEVVKFATNNHPNVFVIWPDVPTTNGSLRFDHSLIPLAYASAKQQLKEQKGDLNDPNSLPF